MRATPVSRPRPARSSPIDDDARADPSWLTPLVRALGETGHAAVGGPNIPPPGDGLVADSVANAPGGPTHVLTSDSEAEHIPGCKMAIRKPGLREIGAFDPRFRVAGDDVDVCWRLQNAGEAIGSAPAPWSTTIAARRCGRTFRQQFQYGKAEALLEHNRGRPGRSPILPFVARYSRACPRIVRSPGWGTRRPIKVEAALAVWAQINRWRADPSCSRYA